MGLRPLEPSEWVELGDRLGADLREKRRLLEDRRDEVVRFIDDEQTVVASRELVDRLVVHLPRRFPGTYSVVDGSMVIDGIDWSVPVAGSIVGGSGVHPVETAGRLTQEDWCVMLPDDTGRWRLV